jgi:hypothetical protein
VRSPFATQHGLLVEALKRSRQALQRGARERRFAGKTAAGSLPNQAKDLRPKSFVLR